MNAQELYARHGITLAELGTQFYITQERRCPICTDELTLGDGTCYDGKSHMVICRRCLLVLNTVRRTPSMYMDRMLKMVKEEKEGDAG